MPPRRPPRRGRDDLLLLVLAARNRRANDKRPSHTLRRLAVAAAVLALLAGGVAGALGAVAVRRALSDCTLDGRTARALPRTSVLYAANGLYLGAVHAETYRRPVAYRDVSKWLRRATVAAEDRTFWTNDGINPRAIVRAALADLRAGRPVQGGSTITQQLVRNLYLNDEKSLSRKREEACLSIKLTSRWSKKRILTAYLNRVAYGHRAVGVEAAAETYFGAHASQLGPAQAALVAGLPQAPTRYDPFVHPRAALARRDEVLRAMRTTGVLTPAQYADAVARPLGLHPGNAYTIRRDPVFFSYVERQLVAAYGARRVRGGGLRVTTTLQPRDQRLAARAVRSVLDRRGDPAAAVVSIQPSTGAIRAMTAIVHGHRMQFDLAADGRRQPGSAFKTFVLTDLILHHANPYATHYDSAPFSYVPGPGQPPWRPHTYEDRFFGDENMVTATLLSDNVVYGKLTIDLGPSSVAQVAHELGVRSPLDPVPSIGLGADSVTPLEMASAYATLAAGGVHRTPYVVAKVALPGGSVDPRWGRSAARRVIPAGAAYWVTDVLQQNVERGTGVNAQIGRPAAGKTGTTSGWTDAWFCGYTRRLATAVWVGYPNRTVSMTDVHGIHVQGGSFPAEIWGRYMRAALAHAKPLPWLRAPWSWTPWHSPRRWDRPAA